jgi:3-oxoacyl-[acyl-carrier protein] reductase
VKPVALITGGARGIGAAIARALASVGHPVILNYKQNHEAARATAGDIERAGGSALLWACDVTDALAVEQGLAEFLADADRPIGVLVNNAGVLKDAPFPALEREDWQRVIRTTLDGFFNVTQPLIMPMARRRWGRIVNIASVSGVIGNRGQTNYSAAKAGLIGATRSLALEFAKRNVTVNAVAPGLIETDMIQNSPIDEIVPHIPMRRLGKPEEVAALVRFLVSEEAAYITGQVIGINGGLA